MKKSKWIEFWIVSSEFKWLWLVAENKYLQCDELEISVLDEVGGLPVCLRGSSWGNCDVLKEGEWKNGVGKQKEGGMLSNGVGFLRRSGIWLQKANCKA